MMDDSSCEYEERRGRPRGRPRGRQRGRQRATGKVLRSCKKNKIDSDEEEPKTFTAEENQPPPFDKDCDISALEAPTFTTIERAPSGPMMQLSWTHPVNLIGEKVLSPRIHTCDTCNKPILIYGRMIPCKHVFCLTCAKSEDRVCARCGERVARVEQTGLGTVFMCTFAVGDALCKRTYLSQRDLQAHIDHRHIKLSKEEAKEANLHRDPRGSEPPIARPPLEQRQNVPPMMLPRGDMRPHAAINDPRVSTGVKEYSKPPEGHEREFNPTPHPFIPRPFIPAQQPHPPATLPAGVSLGCVTTTSLGMNHPLSHHIPVMTSSRSNLITVPIQEPHDPPQYPTVPQPPHPMHGGLHPQPVQTAPHPPPNHNPHQIQHPSHPPPPSHPFTSPPPNPHSQPPPYSSPYSNAPGQQQQGPHFTFSHAPSLPPPQPQGPTPYAVNHPPVPVPPPSGPFGNRLPFEATYGPRQWGPMAAIPQQGLGQPPRHPIPQPTQSTNYYS